MVKVKNKLLVVLSIILCAVLLSAVFVFTKQQTETDLQVKAETIDTSKYTKGPGLYQTDGTFVAASEYLTVSGRSLRVNSSYTRSAGEVYLEGYSVPSNVTKMSYMFCDCNSLTSIIFGSSFNTSNVTDMGNMFYACNNLTNIDLSNFETSKVTNMRYMFESCVKIKSIDVSAFKTENVTDMSSMFDFCHSLESLDLSKFDTKK